jgi:hypothetical protein
MTVLGSRAATRAEAACFDRLARLVAAQIEGLAPPAAASVPAAGGLSPREEALLSGYTPAERARIAAVLDRLPDEATAAALALRRYSAPPAASLVAARSGQPLRDRSVGLFG